MTEVPNRCLIDIGSTIVKVALIGHDGSVARADEERDHARSPGDQVVTLLDRLSADGFRGSTRICSSANGGIRVGILASTERFSGRAAAAVSSASGGNVVFVLTDPSDLASQPEIDVLVLSGGVDLDPMTRLEGRLASLDLPGDRYSSIVYAGSSAGARAVRQRFPQSRIIDNVLGPALDIRGEQLGHLLRSMYLDNLIDKGGIAGLGPLSEVPIWPTPAVMALAFERLTTFAGDRSYPTPFMLFDIGGATTDAYFASDVIDEEGMHGPPTVLSVTRHVFTELGTQSSRRSTLERLRAHPRLLDFLTAFDRETSRERYEALRSEAELEMDPPFLAGVCLFLALEELLDQRRAEPISISRVASVVLTGGGGACLSPELASALVGAVTQPAQAHPVPVILNAGYDIWIEGLLSMTSLEPRRSNG